MTDMKSLTDEQLKEELERASGQLSKAESAYVQAQNLCEALEAEATEREASKRRDVPHKELALILQGWEVRLSDMTMAILHLQGDAKRGLEDQRDLLQRCIGDIKRAMGL